MKRLICFAAAITLAACSNTATLPPSAGVQGSSAATHHRAKGALVLHIHVPKKRRHSGHGARYVSPSTQSMTVAIAGPTPVNQTVGLTPTSTGCTSSLTGTFCTLTIPGLSPGSYTATISTFDATGGTGNELSAAQAIPFTIVAGTNNTIAITLSGIPVATIVSPSNTSTLSNGYGIFALEGSGAHAFVAHTIDIDNNIIVGPGSPTFTISTPTGPLAGVTTSPSSTTTTAPSQFTVTPPSTYAAGTAQFTVTPTFSGQATDGCAQTGANCGAATVIVAMGLPFSWTQLSPAASPSARFDHVMAYDAVAPGQLILFGGDTNGNIYFNDTWNWDGTTWTQLSTAHSPSARSVPAMAYDPGTGTLLLFGGFNGSSILSDTWTWNGTDWTQLSPLTSPPARYDGAMAYDGVHGKMVLYGGASATGALGDTWTWDGTNWLQQSPATSPPARFGASMVNDGGSGTLVLFGGDIFPPGAQTSETWTWDGTTWTQQHPTASPPARRLASMAYDPTFGAPILFGGFDGISTYLNDTWMWNRTTWTQLAPSPAPVARQAFAMAYDTGTNALVLFGGINNTTGLNDTWSGL